MLQAQTLLPADTGQSLIPKRYQLFRGYRLYFKAFSLLTRRVENAEVSTHEVEFPPHNIPQATIVAGKSKSGTYTGWLGCASVQHFSLEWDCCPIERSYAALDHVRSVGERLPWNRRQGEQQRLLAHHRVIRSRDA